NPNHSGFYRNPIVLSNGRVIVSHSTDTHGDGSSTNPSASTFTYRLKTLRKVGNDWVADSSLTSGIGKSVSYYDPDLLVSYTGNLWELDPVEVRARTRPARRTSSLPGIES